MALRGKGQVHQPPGEEGHLLSDAGSGADLQCGHSHAGSLTQGFQIQKQIRHLTSLE